MEMHDICKLVQTTETKFVLATAVYVEGHAYRKQGVSMLFSEQGLMYGSISPGCIETDLSLHAEYVMSTGCPQKIVYDMRPDDDLSWGENIGCGGLLHILLGPVDEALKQILLEMGGLLDRGIQVDLRRNCSADEGAIRDYSVQCIPHKDSEPFKSHAKITHHPSYAAQKWNSGAWLYSNTYTPKPRLIVIGAGNDTIPVVRMALASGFRVVVADWREALVSADRFPGAELLVGFPAEIYPRLQITSQDYILLLSHHYPHERGFLELLSAADTNVNSASIADIPYTYLGILGSRTRTSRLIDGLPSLPRLHAPVGLTIGSEGPEEIAIAIVAELISVKRGQPWGAGKEEKLNAEGRNYSSCRKQSANG
ncbi:XdhC family protein [Paenibacillus urinalis]|uniref:XdhC family protein n=1 Tax=Paenibacillus urinalis TaxID=521520 RepID=A0AAX3MX73_9BACL|nr:XdhC/CoxI family protein [Paenibacillus urinalis]WDH81007.1 XdhC family protein [Paenibacillus urinalis]